MRRIRLVLIVAVLTYFGCAEAADPILVEGGASTVGTPTPTGNADTKGDDIFSGAGEDAPEGEPAVDDSTVRNGNQLTANGGTTDDATADPADPAPGLRPPATTKRQMSYIFVAHPDDEIGAWSTIENSSDNYHVFVLLTRGGHTQHCENPVNKPGMDQYAPTPRDSEACKVNRITSWHRFLNRAAATDRYLDVLDQDAPVVSDVDPTAGRYEAWVGSNSARVVFDFTDGGLMSENLVEASSLVRAMKGTILPDLPDFQAMAGSFYNASYPNCARYDHPDHRAVHVAVFHNDLDTTVQRGRTCATDPDAVYFRTISASTWRTLAGAADFLENGGDPGIFRQSYGWLWGTWEFSQNEDALISRQQSFWERRF